MDCLQQVEIVGSEDPRVMGLWEPLEGLEIGHRFRIKGSRGPVVDDVGAQVMCFTGKDQRGGKEVKIVGGFDGFMTLEEGVKDGAGGELLSGEGKEKD